MDFKRVIIYCLFLAKHDFSSDDKFGCISKEVWELNKHLQIEFSNNFNFINVQKGILNATWIKIFDNVKLK